MQILAHFSGVILPKSVGYYHRNRWGSIKRNGWGWVSEICNKEYNCYLFWAESLQQWFIGIFVSVY